MKYDATLAIRADIVNRIDGLAAQRGHVSFSRICEEVDHIRYTARSIGMDEVERLASILETALALDGHGPVVLSYLDRMRDAASAKPCDIAMLHIIAPTQASSPRPN
jgi:hypothetical protein